MKIMPNEGQKRGRRLEWDDYVAERQKSPVRSVAFILGISDSKQDLILFAVPPAIAVNKRNATIKKVLGN